MIRLHIVWASIQQDFGNDASAFVILEKKDYENKVKLLWFDETTKKELTDTIGRVIYLDGLFNFKHIFVDETGLGAGLADVLKEKLGGKIRGITFTMKSKQDMFNNLKLLLEQQKLQIPAHKKLIYQMLAIEYERKSDGNMKIFHQDNKHDDIVAALCLAALEFRVGQKTRGKYVIC